MSTTTYFVRGALLLVMAACACSSDDGPDERSASIAGRVVVSGPLRGARISVDQLQLDDASGSIREHIGDAITDVEGRYEVGGFGLRNGLVLVTASGGSFTDLVTGDEIVLDPSEQLRSLFWVDLFAQRDGALVSPVGHLVEALARARLAAGVEPTIGVARDVAAEHVHLHFATLDWSQIDPAPLDATAASPVDEVRAAFILGAWSILADDIATSAGASSQEVNPYTLTVALATDLAAPPFDGNDDNDRAHASGVQLGGCAPITGCTPPSSGCTLGACRESCDCYAGTPRAALSGALLKLVQSPLNRTGVTSTAILPTARAVAENTDPILFGAACADELDRVSPTVMFLEPPSPLDGAWVRQTINVRVQAMDDVDPEPDVAWLDGLVDSDGDPLNQIASAAIDTMTVVDGPLLVAAEAIDLAGNRGEASRMFLVDNTYPLLTLDTSTFVVNGADYWTLADPVALTGTITEANLVDVRVFSGTMELATASIIAGSTWSTTLPTGAITASGVDVRIEARDMAGNTTMLLRRLRYDDTAPVLALVPTNVRDERSDAIAFSLTPDPQIGNVPGYNPTHDHSAAPTTVLGVSPAPSCSASAPIVYKHAYLMDEVRPPYVSEAGGTLNGRNPIEWKFSLVDGGVGLDFGYSAYRIRDVTSDQVVLDWQPLMGGVPILDPMNNVIGREYSVLLYRTGALWPSISALDQEGLFEVQFRGRDRFNREVTDARCWNLKLLPSPVRVGLAGEVRQAQNGLVGSNKYALGWLSLSNAQDANGNPIPPYDPIGLHVLSDASPGVGLIEFPIWNPTTESVYVALDLTRPASATYSKTTYDAYWGKAVESIVDIDCGIIGIPPNAIPEYGRPGCRQYLSGDYPADSPAVATNQTATNTQFTVRVFEEVGGSTPELMPCASCMMSSPPPASGDTRVIVQLPPRGPSPSPPRKFWIMPSARIIALRPPSVGGTFTEHTVRNSGQTMILTGAYNMSKNACLDYALINGTYHCTVRGTYRQYQVTTSMTLSGLGQVQTTIRMSRDGVRIDDPVYLVPDRVRIGSPSPWMSSEPSLYTPLPPTSP